MSPLEELFSSIEPVASNSTIHLAVNVKMEVAGTGEMQTNEGK